MKDNIIEPDFSRNVSNVFKKVYDIPISVRYIRMSWASALNARNSSVDEIEETTDKSFFDYVLSNIKDLKPRPKKPCNHSVDEIIQV